MLKTKINRDIPAIFSIILAMCISMMLSFTWKLPQSIANLACAMVLIPYILDVRFAQKKMFLIFLVFINFAYYYSHNTAEYSILTLINTFSIAFMTLFVILSSDKFKLNLYEKFDIFLKIICSISLFGWLLYFFGFSLPNYYSDTTEFYSHYNYYLFIVGADTVFDLLPRFCGMFLEPGHIGSTSCLMLFLNGFNFRKKSNYIYLLSILLSLSLAAYCLFFIGLFLYFILKGSNLVKYIMLLGTSAIVFSVAGLSYNRGDNLINELILSRLVIEDGELSGDNRTSMMFDSYYDKWLKSDDLLYGYGRKAYGDGKSSSNLLHGCASFKRFFFINGIMGVLLLFWLYWYLYKPYASKQGLGFCILFLICNMIRDYPFRLMWLYLFIIGIAVLFHRNKTLHSFQKEKKTSVY